VETLVDSAIAFFGLREDGALLGVSALKDLSTDHVELQSMHTAAAARGRGVGRTMLEHLLSFASERGCRRVSLETGAGEAFAPARALYESAGFVPCGAFAGYEESPNRALMTLLLRDP
jgi:putative acetyltransferase